MYPCTRSYTSRKAYCSNTCTHALEINVFVAEYGSSCLQSQHFGRPRWADHLTSGVQDQAGQHGETLPLLKIQKLAGQGGGCLWSQILRRLRQENCLNPGGRGCISQDHNIALQPGQKERNSVLKKKEYKSTPINPPLWKAKAGWSLEAQTLRSAWPTKQDPSLYQMKIKTF